MSTSKATSPTKIWKETKGDTAKSIPENYESKESFIIDIARAFFNPSFLLMRTDAGRKIVLDELEETITHPHLANKDKEAINAFAPDICAYVKDVIEEMESNEPHPELNDLKNKHDTELHDLSFKRHVRDLMHKDPTPSLIDQDIYQRSIEDRKSRKITGQGMTIHDLIKKLYPDLYPGHILTLVPYMRKALTTNFEFPTKAKIIKEAKAVTNEPSNDASADPS